MIIPNWFVFGLISALVIVVVGVGLGYAILLLFCPCNRCRDFRNRLPLGRKS